MADPATLPKYQSAESNGSNKPKNLPGIYRHEASGKEIITSADMNDGSVQADAFVRVGFRRVGDVPTRAEHNKIREVSYQKSLAEDRAKKLSEKVREKEIEQEVAKEVGVTYNGTADPSIAELKDELAATKATLTALQNGLKKPEKK